ncbi:MAG: hypothetical protein EPO55_19280 [Reyranella sp.]|uniref:hypothetical protein n=1 Tax=Reyranella sp. TaxID=1929291 RepID=UPI001212E75D|nr:hypothetical protein [Reyranella sp.]TAJ37276.1 MAG: hypothetical protein EPO55_19280 [Reyranella sp.]
MPGPTPPIDSNGPPRRRIEVRLSKLRQLFNSLDPSPFHEKDLDRDAETYIFESADERPVTEAIELIVHLPADQLALPECVNLETAIRNYFAYRAQETRRRMRFQLREGRSALAIGLAFLVLCMTLRQLALVLPGDTVGRVLQEGLLILGWVAMWRPLQIFLYDWWPIRHQALVNDKLALMPVTVLPYERAD